MGQSGCNQLQEVAALEVGRSSRVQDLTSDVEPVGATMSLDVEPEKRASGAILICLLWMETFY